MAWDGVITNAGDALLQQWASEKTLHITSATAGTGRVSSVALREQTALADQRQTASIISAEQISSGWKLKLQLAAQDIGYNMSQYGIWAQLDDGNPTLLALFQNNADIPIPSEADSPDFVYTFYALLAFSNTGKLELHIDTSATVTIETMREAIGAAVATKQDKILAAGLLKGDGKGNVTAAIPGEDYGLPVIVRSGAPTENTSAVVSQHYFDATTGKEYVCTEVSKEGKARWQQAGATNASDLTYGGGNLSDFLDELADDVAGSKPLTGYEDPTDSTKGAIGQHYINTTTGEVFTCVAADDETGTYTWKESGGGIYPHITVTAPTGCTITISDGSTTFTPVEQEGVWEQDVPNFGTWTVKAEQNGKAFDIAVVIDEVKPYTVEFPPIIADKTLNNNDWETISIISQAGTGALYWDVGDAKEIELNGKVGDFLTLDHKKLCVFILGFNHKDNGVARNGILWGGFKTAVTGGVDVALVDSKYDTSATDGSKTFNMNHNGNSNMGGWKGCDFRYDILGACSQAPANYNSAKVANNAGYDATATTLTSPVTNTLLAAFQDDFRKVMMLRTHYVDNVGNSSDTDAGVTAVTDAISLLAEYEIFGVRNGANEYEQNHQAQVQYYADGNDRRRYSQDNSADAVVAFTCSPYNNSPNGFCSVGAGGFPRADAAHKSIALCLALLT